MTIFPQTSDQLSVEIKNFNSKLKFCQIVQLRNLTSSPEKKLGQIVVKFVIFEGIVIIVRPEKIWQNGPFFTPAKVKKLGQIVVSFTIFKRIVFKPEKNPSQTVQFGVFYGVIFTSTPEKNLGQRVEGKKIRL